ncbi:MAG: hypothetical protein HUJ54_04420 [Erysipelotrichaceae bacterium]|nr:hypothetical protein [Erysipelotrichaceae bacterium]
MNQIHLLENLNNFIRDPNPSGQAVLVTGEWGCGKSYFIKNELLKTLKSKSAPALIWISLAGLPDTQSIVNAVLTGRLAASDDNDEISGLKKVLKVKISSLNSLPSAPAVYVFDDLERCQVSAAAIFGILSPLIEDSSHKVIFIGDESRLSQDSASSGYHTAKEKTISETISFQPDLTAVFEQIISSLKTVSPSSGLFGSYRSCLTGLAGSFAEIMNETRHRSIRTFKYFLSRLQRIIESYIAVHPDENLMSSLPKLSDDLLRLCILQREGRSLDHYKIHDVFCLKAYLKDGDLAGCLNKIELERRIPNDDPYVILKNKGQTLEEKEILAYAAAIKKKLAASGENLKEDEIYPVTAYLKINELYSFLDYLGMSSALEREKVSLNALLPLIEANIQEKYAQGALADLEEAYMESSVYRGRDNDTYQFGQTHEFIREKIADSIVKIYRKQLAKVLKESEWGDALMELYQSMADKNYFFALLRPDEWTECILNGKIQDLKTLCTLIDLQAAGMQAGSYGGEFQTLKDIRSRLRNIRISDRMTANAVNEVIEHISAIPGAQ